MPSLPPAGESRSPIIVVQLPVGGFSPQYWRALTTKYPQLGFLGSKTIPYELATSGGYLRNLPGTWSFAPVQPLTDRQALLHSSRPYVYDRSLPPPLWSEVVYLIDHTKPAETAVIELTAYDLRLKRAPYLPEAAADPELVPDPSDISHVVVVRVTADTSPDDPPNHQVQVTMYQNTSQLQRWRDAAAAEADRAFGLHND